MQIIHLQGIGKVKAIPANELKIGSVIVWNYGYTSEVSEIAYSKTGKTLTVTLRSNTDGKTYDRKLGSNRLVAIK